MLKALEDLKRLSKTVDSILEDLCEINDDELSDLERSIKRRLWNHTTGP